MCGFLSNHARRRDKPGSQDLIFITKKHLAEPTILSLNITVIFSCNHPAPFIFYDPKKCFTQDNIHRRLELRQKKSAV